MRGRSLLICTLVILSGGAYAASTLAQTSTSGGEKLQYVIYLSRHGVRSPTGKPEQYEKFSASAWPEWPVKPGYLTPRGYELMKLFGAYDRIKLVDDGLLAPAGCGDATHVTILADSDQRTRETGKALAEGLMPGCGVEVHALAEGTHDPLFHGMSASEARLDPALAVAAIGGRIGGDPNNLAQAYRPQLAALDKILAGCGKLPCDQRGQNLSARYSCGAAAGQARPRRGVSRAAGDCLDALRKPAPRIHAGNERNRTRMGLPRRGQPARSHGSA